VVVISTLVMQSCIAPDYLLCSRRVQDVFIAKAVEFIKAFHGTDAQKSPWFGRIVNKAHFA
jgi:acyl-CoA reductase-like NAD-dependent aldehyde dehydrogenase